MYKLGFYVPAEQLEEVKSALFEAGAGRIGNYDRCCWQTEGVGQFRPLDGSKPFLGRAGAVEQVREYRVEMVCAEDRIAEVVRALGDVHPYEEPAFDVVKLESDFSTGEPGQ